MTARNIVWEDTVDYARALSRWLLALAALCVVPAQAQMPGHQEHNEHAHAMGANGSCATVDLRCATAATPLLTDDGTLWLTWTAGGAVMVARSHDLGKTFEPSTVVGRSGESLDVGPDARPQILRDGGGAIIVAYGVFKDKNWNARIEIARSNDGGKTFSEPAILGKDAASERFPTLTVAPNGHVFATWIDKRLIAAAKTDGVDQAGGSVAYAWSTDGGQTFSETTLAQESSCECCRIGIALAPDGMPVIAYRAIFGHNVRDHATQHFVDERTAGPVQRVSVDDWATDACPHHGPAVAVSSTGMVHVAWYTQGNARSGLFYAHSEKGGAYSEPVRLGHIDRLPGRPSALAIDRHVWLAWKEFDGHTAQIYAQHSDNDGKTWTPAMRVAEAAGYSDHPLLLRAGHRIYVSWFARDAGYRLISLGMAR